MASSKVLDNHSVPCIRCKLGLLRPSPSHLRPPREFALVGASRAYLHPCVDLGDEDNSRASVLPPASPSRVRPLAGARPPCTDLSRWPRADPRRRGVPVADVPPPASPSRVCLLAGVRRAGALRTDISRAAPASPSPTSLRRCPPPTSVRRAGASRADVRPSLRWRSPPAPFPPRSFVASTCAALRPPCPNPNRLAPRIIQQGGVVPRKAENQDPALCPMARRGRLPRRSALPHARTCADVSDPRVDCAGMPWGHRQCPSTAASITEDHLAGGCCTSKSRKSRSGPLSDGPARTSPTPLRVSPCADVRGRL